MAVFIYLNLQKGGRRIKDGRHKRGKKMTHGAANGICCQEYIADMRRYVFGAAALNRIGFNKKSGKYIKGKLCLRGKREKCY